MSKRPARKRAPIRQTVLTVYAWIAAIDGRELVATVDIAAPGGIGSRAVPLISPRKAEAERMQTLARRLLDDSRYTSDPLRAVTLYTFERIGPPLVTFNPTSPNRKPRT